MDPETATEAVTAGMREIAFPWAVGLDVLVAVLAFLFKVFLLWITVSTISRGTAAFTAKGLLLTTLGLSVAYFCVNPMLQTENILIPLVIVVLIGSLVIKKAFWISFDRAFFASIIVCLLSVAVGDRARHNLDTIYPTRATLNMASASAIDEYARINSGETILPPSMGTLNAMVRLTVTTNTEGIVGTTLSFLRAGLEAKEQVERLRRQAEMEARIANILAGGGNKVANRAQEMQALKQFFGESTNAPRRIPVSGTFTGAPGFAGAYASAKSQIIEINRIASNNAIIVNMLSGAGTNVGDRAEEMAKLQQALLDEARAQGIDLSATSDVDMAVLEQAVANVVAPDAAAPPEGVDLAEALAGGLLIRDGLVPAAAAQTVGATAADASKAWMFAAADLDMLAPETTAPPAATPPPSDTDLLMSGFAGPPGSPDLAGLMFALLGALEIPTVPIESIVAPVPAKLTGYAALTPEQRTRWRLALNQIKVSGVVSRPDDVSAFVKGKLVRRGDIHVVVMSGNEFPFRLGGVNKKGQCIWEPVVETDTAATASEIEIGF
ncbi:MAG TPA: hypothetical protein VIH35_05945 [Kiritimatiellia bacterium]|jgi:hypothetical protein